MTFYRALDNSGYVRVNFISDDTVAIAMNEAGRTERAKRVPAVSSPGYMGGYAFPVLDHLADGRTYQILKAQLPQEGSKQYNQIAQIARAYETLWSYVDSGDVTIVQVEGWDRRATPLSHYGITINSGPKTFKRLKTLNRPFRLWNKLDRPLRVHVVDDDAYSDVDLEALGFTEADVEMLLDGAFTISRELFANCLNNVRFPELPDPDAISRPELMVDQYRAQEYLRQAQYFHAFNARIIGQMDFGSLHHDDELWTRPGMLKGEAFINVSDICERMRVDVICTRSALKFEVASSDLTYVFLEPQKAKTSGVNSDLQTMVNLPAVFGFEDVSSWLKEYVMGSFERLKNNQIMESWYDMSSPYFNSSARQFGQNDVVTLSKWNARAWLMSGRKITESPWLFEQMAAAIIKPYRDEDQRKLRFPIPCAVRAQVISQSFASMSGADISVEFHEARWVPELESIVVSDDRWNEMYRSHGGMDLDDFFNGFYRTVGNLRKIILTRSPNDWGEYTMLDYVEGDWYPEFEGYQGNIMIFPQVSDDPALWPARLSEEFAAGKVLYTGMPSENNPAPKGEARAYGVTDVLDLLISNKEAQSCVGANVNSRILHSASMRSLRPAQLAPLEACIDAGTQGGSADDTAAVHAEAKQIIEEILRSDAPIDEYIWMSRFADIYQFPFDRARLNGKTDISKSHRYRVDVARSFMSMVREYVQLNLAQVVDPLVHRLGKRLLRPAGMALIDTRYAMVGMQNPGEQNLIPGDWGDVHGPILNTLNDFEKISDRHDFMMGLYSACFKVPTASTRKISDQLVMNPHLFPYLLDAMRFYGMAYYVTINAEGKIDRTKVDEWDLKCPSCGNEVHTNDPMVWQGFNVHDGVCKACRTTAAE